MINTSNSAVLSLLTDSDRTVSAADEDIRERKVIDSSGQNIGQVADLLIDETEHRVRFLLVEHGGLLGFGRTRTLIPVRDITAVDAYHVHIDHTKDHVVAGPGYDPDIVADADCVDAIHAHYNTSPAWGSGYGFPPSSYNPTLDGGSS